MEEGKEEEMEGKKERIGISRDNKRFGCYLAEHQLLALRLSFLHVKRIVRSLYGWLPLMHPAVCLAQFNNVRFPFLIKNQAHH